MAPHPVRPGSSDSVLLLSMTAILVTLLGLLVLAACTATVEPESEPAGATTAHEADRRSSGSADSSTGKWRSEGMNHFAVALFGMLLRESEFKGEGDFELAASLAKNALGVDLRGERAEFLRLVALAKQIEPDV